MATQTPSSDSQPFPPAPRPGLVLALRQGALIAARNVRSAIRRPDVVTFYFVQPIIFTLLFVYVLGGAIEVPGGNYVDFLMPGIIVVTLVFDAPITAIGLNEDLSKGVLDRFRALPIARSAVLTGRLAADAMRALTVTLTMIAVGYMVGFRFQNGLIPAIGAVAVAFLFAVAIQWGSAIIGMMMSTPEAVQAAVFTAIFPLAFASSVYVPVESMPGWLQAFAKANPITVVADAARTLSLGGPVAGDVILSLAWSVGMIAVFVPLAVARYRKLP